MGNKTNVKLKVSKIPGDGQAIGVTITYQVGVIPVAVLNIIPHAEEGGTKITTGFGNIEPYKRSMEADIEIEVESYFAPQDRWIKKKLKFSGFLDGLSLHHSVGQNTYQAVYKNKAQVLMELTSLTPGMYPTSINIFRNPDFRVQKQVGKNEEAVKGWGRFSKKIDFTKPPIVVYTEVIKTILKNQENGDWKKYAGCEKLTTKELPFEKIYNDERYKKALKIGKEFFDKIDISGVSEGDSVKVGSSHANINSALIDLFSSAPTAILENYLHFLSYMGCSMIFGNTKMFVVPGNSVLKPKVRNPEHQELGDINEAFAADFSSFSYNDNGYKDLAHVIVIPDNGLGGAYTGSPTFCPGNLAHYSDPDSETGVSHATGVLVIRSHPFMQVGPWSRSVEDSKIPPEADGGGTLHTEKKNLKDAADESEDGEKKSAKTKKENHEKTVGKEKGQLHFENFAQTRLYQEKYQERTGSITMEFSPNWVPGTGGVLVIRQGNTEGGYIFVSFNVVSVTHHIATTSPANGQATTVVGFNCARIGEKPFGVDKYEYFGYDNDKESTIKSKYLDDLKAEWS